MRRLHLKPRLQPRADHPGRAHRLGRQVPRRDRARGSRSDGEGLGETLFSAPPVEEDAGVAVDEDAGVASGDDAGTPETDAGVLGMEDASRPGADAGAGRVDGGGRAELMGGCAVSPSRAPLPLAFFLLALVPLMRRRVR